MVINYFFISHGHIGHCDYKFNFALQITLIGHKLLYMIIQDIVVMNYVCITYMVIGYCGYDLFLYHLYGHRGYCGYDFFLYRLYGHRGYCGYDLFLITYMVI